MKERENEIGNLFNKVICKIDDLIELSNEYCSWDEWEKAEIINNAKIVLSEGFKDELEKINDDIFKCITCGIEKDMRYNKIYWVLDEECNKATCSKECAVVAKNKAIEKAKRTLKNIESQQWD